MYERNYYNRNYLRHVDHHFGCFHSWKTKINEIGRKFLQFTNYGSIMILVDDVHGIFDKENRTLLTALCLRSYREYDASRAFF